MSKKPSTEPKLKAIIRKFISSFGDLKAERHNPKLDFQFEFTHPKGILPNGKPTGIGFQVLKPKKEDFVEIGSRINIGPNAVKILGAIPKKKMQLFNSITKLSLLKNGIYVISC
jgi:hypothetical protein